MIFTLMSCMCEIASSSRLIIGASSLRAEEAACLSRLDDCLGLGSQREDTAHLIKDKVPLPEGHPSPFFSLSPGTAREEYKQPHSSREPESPREQQKESLF